MTPEAISSRSRLLDRKLRDLHQHRADLVVEVERIGRQLSELYHRNHLSVSGEHLFMERLSAALRHRESRIPVLLQHVDRDIEQAQADLDNFKYWHPQT